MAILQGKHLDWAITATAGSGFLLFGVSFIISYNLHIVLQKLIPI